MFCKLELGASASEGERLRSYGGRPKPGDVALPPSRHTACEMDTAVQSGIFVGGRYSRPF